MEFYGTGNLCQAARNRRSLNLQGLRALDLRCNKPDGTPWDFRRREDRDLAVHSIETEKPLVIIGCPPCTAFSSWNTHMNYARMPADRVDAMLEEGKLHLRFMIKLYKM